MKDSVRFRKLKLLIVDDDEENVVLAKKMLQKTETMTAHVSWIADAEEALHQILHDSFDAIIVDYSLNHETGFNFIIRAKKAGCTCPFILLTGVHDEQLGVQAIRHGAEDYLVKNEITPGLFEKSVLYAIERSQLKQSERKLHEKQLLEQREDEFLSIASHELKTPLTTIKGYIQLLDKYLTAKQDKKALQYIHQSDRYVDKLNQLISDLLDISRIQSGRLQLNLEPIALDELFTRIITALQHLSPKHIITFTTTCSPQVICDVERIEQVVTNLITNAIKYSPAAKKIEIRLSCIDGYAQAAVRDWGVGIPKKDQKNVFQRFYRATATAKQFSGLGIGLYISHEIIKRHKGDMCIESTPGKGSTFYFTLPLHT